MTLFGRLKAVLFAVKLDDKAAAAVRAEMLKFVLERCGLTYEKARDRVALISGIIAGIEFVYAMLRPNVAIDCAASNSKLTRL